MTETRHQLSYNGEGVSITEYEVRDDGKWVLSNEWWFTWAEVFAELTGEVEFDQFTVLSKVRPSR